MRKDNPDKVGYEKAREEKICELKCLYAFPDDIFTSYCGLPTALDILRKFDIAEGERRYKNGQELHDELVRQYGRGRQQAVREAIEKVKELKEYHSANADEAGRVREWESFNKEGYVSMKLEEVLSILKQIGGGESGI